MIVHAVFVQFVMLCRRILVLVSLFCFLPLSSLLFCCQTRCFSTHFELCPCAYTLFISHIGIRQVEPFSSTIQYSSAELPLQSQSLKASIISKGLERGREAGRERGSIVIYLYVGTLSVLHVSDIASVPVRFLSLVQNFLLLHIRTALVFSVS